LSPAILADLLPLILSHCDSPALATCLRVSQLFFQASGPILYRHLTYNDRSDPFIGLDPPRGRGKRGHAVPKPTDFSKHALIRHTRTIDIETHTSQCGNLSPKGWLAHLTSLRAVRIIAEPQDLFELCSEDPCNLVDVLQPPTVVIHGLSSPCAEIPFGLDRPQWSTVNKVVLRFVPSWEVYRASRDYRIYNIIPPTVQHVVLHFTRVGGRPVFADGPGRLFVDDFDDDEADDEFGLRVTLEGLADLYADLMVSNTERRYTVLDPGAFDPVWAGVPAGGECEVREAVEKAIRGAVDGRLKRMALSDERRAQVLDRLEFKGLREYVADRGVDGEYLASEVEQWAI
jgi:hypothetical protein